MRKLWQNQKGDAILLAVILALIGFAGLAFMLSQVGQYTNSLRQSELTANLSDTDKFNLWLLQKKFQSSVNSSGAVVLPDWYPNPYPIPSEMSRATTFKPNIATMATAAATAYAGTKFVRGSKNTTTGACSSLPSPICKKSPLAADDCDALDFTLDGAGLGSIQKLADLSSDGIQNACLGVPDYGLLTSDQKTNAFNPSFSLPLETSINSLTVTFKKYIADDDSKPNTLTKMVVQLGGTTGIIPIAPPPAATSCSLSLNSPAQPIDVSTSSKTVNLSLSANGITESVSFFASGSDNPEFQSVDLNRQSLKDYGTMKPLKTGGFNVVLSMVAGEPVNPANSQEFLRTINATVKGHSGNSVQCNLTLRIKKYEMPVVCVANVAQFSSAVAEKTTLDSQPVFTFKASDPNVKVLCPGFVRVLAVGGGGGGRHGGGGGGGFIEKTVEISASQVGQTIGVVVGAGGVTDGIISRAGGDSSVFEITAKGGGAGGFHLSKNNGGPGGAGGGASFNYLSFSFTGGQGIWGQGYRGTDSYGTSDTDRRTGGGGGGAGGRSPASSANGGPGKASDISGILTYYGGGGGGSNSGLNCGLGYGAGGLGGGGAGSYESCISTTRKNLPYEDLIGKPNTGGGGGCGSGGSGIVILRSTSPVPPTCTGLKVTWSNTSHGKCDYTVTGDFINKVVLNNGTRSIESFGKVGTIDCSPWEGNYGDLTYSATAMNSVGQTAACPAYTLPCNGSFNTVRVDVAKPVNISVTDAGISNGTNIYRHWLWLSLSTNSSSGVRSVTIGPHTESRSEDGVGGVGLAVSSKGNYTGGDSGKFRTQSSNNVVTYFDKVSIPALEGNMSVSRTGNSKNMDLYIEKCTNTTTTQSVDKTTFDKLK